MGETTKLKTSVLYLSTADQGGIYKYTTHTFSLNS